MNIETSITVIKKLTQENHHTEARIILAELVGKKQLLFILETIHKDFLKIGYISDLQMETRLTIERSLLRSAKMMFPDYYIQIKRSL